MKSVLGPGEILKPGEILSVTNPIPIPKKKKRKKITLAEQVRIQGSPPKTNEQYRKEQREKLIKEMCINKNKVDII